MANSKQMEGGAGGSPGGIDISIPDAPDPKGGIEIEGKAGTAETLLLYAIQVRETANRIGAAVAGFVKQGTVIVIAGDPEIDVGLADQFDTACTELDRLLDEALRPITPPAQDVAAESLVAGAAVSAIGTILKASATAAQYFAVKTKLAGIEITPNDSLLAIAVAGVLLEQKPPPKVYPAPFETSDARKSVHERIGALGTKAGRAQVAAQDYAKRAASDAQNAALWNTAAQTCEAAAKCVNEFNARFAKDEKEGGLPINKIIQQTALRTALDGGAVALFVKTQATGGSLRTKSGLFVGIGNDTPAAAGALLVASHALVEGQGRTLLQARTHNSWSGYRGLDNLVFLDDQPESNRYYNG